MAPMNNRLLRPTANAHHEARDWAARVVANGGAVSTPTLAAVSTFCRSIDKEPGLRSAILRLNLFCGSNLNACLVPLYRASSPFSGIIGNATDTNNGPFVSGDYNETGAAGGLKGNGASKYLDTGVSPQDFASLVSVHLSSSGSSLETSGNYSFIGTADPPNSARIYELGIFADYVSGRPFRAGSFIAGEFPVVSSPDASEGHIIGTRTSASLATIYRDGVPVATNSTTLSPVSHANTFFVFAINSAGAANVTAARLRMYSIGSGLTEQQSSAFSDAVSAFNLELNR